MSHYYIEGIGYHPIDSKYLPSQMFWINKVDILDLYILKISNDFWVQKNYKSGKIRIIKKTKSIQEIKDLEAEIKKVNMKKIEFIFNKVDEILNKQEELKMMYDYNIQ